MNDATAVAGRVARSGRNGLLRRRAWMEIAVVERNRRQNTRCRAKRSRKPCGA